MRIGKGKDKEKADCKSTIVKAHKRKPTKVRKIAGLEICRKHA